MRAFDSRPRFARPGYYITSVSFCQGVFEKFFEVFFKLLFKPLSNLRRKCPTIISHLFLFVKRFLKSFSKIFVIFGILCFSQSDPISISHLFSFVKRFFKSFSTFFDLRSGPVRLPSLAFPRRSRSVLAYYSTSSSNCQEVFFNFFHFGSLGTLS